MTKPGFITVYYIMVNNEVAFVTKTQGTAVMRKHTIGGIIRSVEVPAAAVTI